MRITKRWAVRPTQSDDLVEQLLLNRGIRPATREQFLAPDYARDLHDPFSMKGMGEAVERVSRAVQSKEKVAIYGDYDADGTPGAALLADFFSQLGLPIQVFIPTRAQGYGLHVEAIKDLAKAGASLLITVDCGIRNAPEIAEAKKLGLDTIVCDHHLPSDELPKANILDPKQQGDSYPFKELCGAGVAFKLAQAIAAKAATMEKNLSASELQKFLKWEMDLVGLATIVDMVPLIGENRVLAKFGLIALQKTRRLGLQKLYEVTGIDPPSIKTYAVSFLIGPCLNAAGRMDHATQSYYLLTEKNPEKAALLANELNDINHRRQQLLEKVLRETKQRVEKEKLYKRKIIVVAGEGWPHGIVGLVAGKLMDEYARPALVISKEKIRSRGSARSIEAFHIVEALDHCQEYLLRYGGHAQAAGFSLETKHLSALYDKLLEYAEGKLTDEDLVPTLTADAELPFEAIDQDLVAAMTQFEPHGLGNPRPHFISRDGLVQQVRAVGTNGHHLKLTVSGKEAIAFDLGELAHEIVAGDVIDLIYSVEENIWNGRSSVQLKVLDIKKSGLE